MTFLVKEVLDTGQPYQILFKKTLKEKKDASALTIRYC